MSQTKTYLVNDPAAVAEKVKAVGGLVIDLNNPTGTASKDDITINWDIVPGTPMQVMITITHKPFVLTYGSIWAYIDPIFE
jgi:hypothetical protein